ncbi:MAG: isocitrate/isopropylmalate dehydrogenase family protein [Polyangiales bacterium]
MSRSWRIAVMPGDGIGPEVTRAALQVLDALAERGGLEIGRDELQWPSTAYHREHGEMMPVDWHARLEGYDALLLGALGDPGPADEPGRYVLPDSVSLAPLLAIRQGFDLWACERPAVLLEGAPQLLSDERARDVDMLVIRENSEGEYVGQGGRLRRGTPDEVATQVEVFTRAGTERIVRHAFERARKRAAEREAGTRADRSFPATEGGEARAQVCLVTKRNAVAYAGALYTEVFEALAPEYPDVATRHELVDAACMKMVAQPWGFDVVVASNLHGDILTDLAAVLCGGMGVAPSSNLCPSDRSRPPLFEPTHGSAPDIAGKDRAGPFAMMLTVCTMLEWMGEQDPRAGEAARRLWRAVERDMAEHGTAGRGTRAVAESVVERLKQEKPS